MHLSGVGFYNGSQVRIFIDTEVIDNHAFLIANGAKEGGMSVNNQKYYKSNSFCELSGLAMMLHCPEKCLFNLQQLCKN